MAEKKYYWLKLKKDFFKRHDIKIIENMPNGKDYVLFYLKMLVESIDHEGKLRFNDSIPYDENMLATITNTNKDIVLGAMKLFKQLEMVEILDDKTIYMNEVIKFIGSETYWAERKRIQRSKTPIKSLNVGQCPDSPVNVQAMSTQELDIELDKDKDKDKDLKRNTCPFQDVQALFLKICTSLPKIKGITDKRKKVLRIWWQKGMTLEKFERFFKLVEASDFLTGRVKDFTASFDWIIKPENRQKIIEGNYDNKETVKTGSITDTIDFEAIYRKKEEEERIMNNASNTIKGGN
jgi:predicted phage replisome organizer